MATNNLSDKGKLEELESYLKTLGESKTIITSITEAIGSMYDEADTLNNAFLQGRNRMDEMSDAVSRAAAGVIRLGGDISDVGDTMINIADGARRNVIATEDQVSKLFAASRILTIDSQTLVENFAKVGIETSNIGPNLEESIKYIQSIGLNAKTVTRDVVNNMDLMNRFNFSDGVQGLTKMAAQASMLRWDMSQTATFAEKVMTPEGAINTASALQRLGVAVGQLGDPFALMNDAINDPGALQDSLIKATKQFTEFDEKTQRFKINPQGILTLKEMAIETGVNYDQLAKSALAAADLDTRLSKINPSINFKNEDDKKLLANMATMGDEGEYVVQIKNDETQIVEQKKLSEITAEEFEKLRNQPKTLEEIQTSQLDVIKNIQTTLQMMVATASYGVAGSSAIRGTIAGAERVSRAVTTSIDTNMPNSADITKNINNAITKMEDVFIQRDAKQISDKDFAKQISSLENDIKNSASGLGKEGIETLKKILDDINKNIKGNSVFENYIKGVFKSEKIDNNVTSKSTVNKTAITGTKVEPVKYSVFAKQNTVSNTPSITSKSSVDFGGTITIKIDAPAGVDQKYLDNVFKSDDFKQMIYKYYDEKSKNNLLARKN